MSHKETRPRDLPDTDLDDLQQRIDAQREAHRSKTVEAPRTAWQLGMRYGSEFFAGVLVGGGIGFMLDAIAPTGPWGLIVGTFLGFAAGTLNVVRAARDINAENSSSPDGK